MVDRRPVPHDGSERHLLRDQRFREIPFQRHAGIKKKDLLAWKKAHDAEDIKRRALEKLTPEERKVLGLS